MNIKIRNERKGDVEPIHRVTVLAFQDAPHTDHTEPFIVKALRRADALFLSKVAESDGDVIGHVAISPVSVSDGSANWFGLGPISVLPEYQGKGIGSKLMENVLAGLKEQGAAGCVVLGDPGYYGRFGFKVVDGLVFPGVPVEYFQALSFGDDFPQGDVAYHEAFSARD
ncbi:GNAT family N-acetyltransferase [Marinobacter bohaiensis]|uniref:GNAT family N-acetyltransferase n=1 Tax=Marinobacter bohaiensis TaxID=2201898 RepID=UPI000DAD6AD9|nr:N-acetyltransferase [Marinobacter bohaiensis]